MRRGPEAPPSPEFELEHKGKREKLTPIDEEQNFNLKAQARHWAELLTRDKKGETKSGPRVEQASINNRLYKYCRGGGTGVLKAFGEEIQKLPFLSEEEKSKEMRKLLGGIKNLEMAVNEIKSQFRDKNRGDAEKQTLAMNDYLDAANMVDLIEIIENEKGGISRINLVQVKGLLDTTPQSLIQSRHQECLDKISSIEDAMIPERLKAMQKAKKEFYRELSETDGEAALELMTRYEKLLDFILDSGLDDLDNVNQDDGEKTEEEKSIKRMREIFNEESLQTFLDQADMRITELVEVFGQSQSLEILIQNYAGSMDADDNEIKAALRAARALEANLSHRKLTPKELATSYPNVELPSNIIPFTEVYSVTYRENQLVGQPVRLISGPSPKALTKN